MDMFTIIGACLRRWWVTLPILALTGYLAAASYQAVEPVYTSSASIVVLPGVSPDDSESEEEADSFNPYSGSGGGPRLAASVLSRNIDGSAFRDRLGLAEAPDLTWEASTADQQPIVTIDVTGPTPEIVLDVLDRITAEAAEVLIEFQSNAGASEGAGYRAASAGPSDMVDDVTPSRLRTAGAIAVVGAGLAAGFAAGVDALLTARRRRAEANTAKPKPILPKSDDGSKGLRASRLGSVDRASGPAEHGGGSGGAVVSNWVGAAARNQADQRNEAEQRNEVEQRNEAAKRNEKVQVGAAHNGHNGRTPERQATKAPAARSSQARR